MTTAEQLYAVSTALPPTALAELLDFAEFLRQKNDRPGTTLRAPLKTLAGGLEGSKNFSAPPLTLQEDLRREWD